MRRVCSIKINRVSICLLIFLFYICGVLFSLKCVEKILQNTYRSFKEEPIPPNSKTILFWHPFFSMKDYDFGFGNKPFFYHGCKVVNCYTTDKRDILREDQYDAIIFHGPYVTKGSEFPATRSSHQRYVYFSMESPDNRPVYSSLSGVFNTTLTYRIDSDVQVPYFRIATLNGNVVAPSVNPNWMKPTYVREINSESFKQKTKAVAWFVSNCKTKNMRENLVKKLQEYIQVDIYGECGNLYCPRSDENYCSKMLSQEYYFYLSFENSNCIDYITEKVLTALENNVIPIILSGANLTRFLPPGSYINARGISMYDLSKRMQFLMDNPESYGKYFWWKDYYKFVPTQPFFCKLCEILNSESSEQKSYENLQEWWHGFEDNFMCKSF